MAPFQEHFASLPDPRVVGRSDHKLLDIIAIAILATICVAEGWDDFADFGECNPRLPRDVRKLDGTMNAFFASFPESFLQVRRARPEGWDDFAEFGECKQTWLKTFLDLPAGIPSADTFRRVLSV